MLIAIIGGIGSGKSMLGYFLREKGYAVLDSDAIAREVVQPGTEGMQKIREEFGEGYCLPDGNLDRDKMAKRIFSDGESRKKLNEITHPLIAENLKEKLSENNGKNVFVEIPLFSGCGMEELFDEVWLVISDRNTRITRIMGRDRISREEAEARIDSGQTDEELSGSATKILYNNGNIGEFQKQVDALVN